MFGPISLYSDFNRFLGSGKAGRQAWTVQEHLKTCLKRSDPVSLWMISFKGLKLMLRLISQSEERSHGPMETLGPIWSPAFDVIHKLSCKIIHWWIDKQKISIFKTFWRVVRVWRFFSMFSTVFSVSQVILQHRGKFKKNPWMHNLLFWLDHGFRTYSLSIESKTKWSQVVTFSTKMGSTKITS